MTTDLFPYNDKKRIGASVAYLDRQPVTEKFIESTWLRAV